MFTTIRLRSRASAPPGDGSAPHGSSSGSADQRTGRARIRVAAAVTVAVGAALAMAPTALAAGASLYADGLHISTGALVDPNGRVWIADHNAGFCRVTDPTPSAPGTIENPQFPGDTTHGTPTCLGGLLPGAGTGPDAAQGAVLYTNALKGETFAFVADGSAPSAEVVRAKWNPVTGKFDFQDTITMDADPVRPVRSRPNSISLGPDDMIYTGFQASATIQRFDPALAAPVAERVGRTSDGRGSTAVAAGFDDAGAGAPTVYVAQAVGLWKLHPSAAAPSTSASFVTGADSISALAYDLPGHLLYAGTSNGVTLADKGIDKLHRFGTDAGHTPQLAYATGFSMVGGLGVRPDGNVFVLDDEAIITPGQPIGTGKLYLVGLPVAHIVSGPTNAAGLPASNPAFTNDSTSTFTVDGDPRLECSLVAAGAVAAWQDCTTKTFTADPALADGAYVFSVRSVGVGGEGVPEGRSFTVDTAAPAAAITAPVNGATVSGSPRFAFSTEAFASFQCSFDDSAFTDCAPGNTRVFGSNGTHTLRIKAIDRAGNVSAASEPLSFTVDVTAPTVTIDSPPEGAATGGSPVFTFNASEAGSTYRCRLNDQPFAACGSPQGYAGVAAGTHTFQVRATDAVGNIGSVVTRTFSVGGGTPAPGDPAGIPATLTGAGTGGGPTATAAPGGATTTQHKPFLRSLSSLSRVRRSVASRSGIRVVMRVGDDTNVVRIRVFRRLGNGKRVLIATRYRSPKTAGLYRVRLTDAALRRKLRVGSYELDATPGMTRSDLGIASGIGFKIIKG